MKRGFLLFIGSLALALVHADLPSGYPGTAHGDPVQLQYLPGARPPEDDGRRIRPLRVEGRGKRPLRPPLPNEFRGSLEEGWGSVPGEAGVDYPTYFEVPATSFTCEGKAAGYYADPETRCQTFHVCTSGGSTSNSFLCPNGTLFNTAVRTCDWWPAVDCGSFSDSLRLNQDIARTKQKTYPSEAGRSQPLRSKSKRPEGGIASQDGSLHSPEIRHHTPQQYVSEKYDNSVAKDEQRAEERNSERRRPKPFLSALRKQKQRLRVTTQATQNGFDAEENYPTEIPPKPSTLRSTPLRRTKFTPRPLTVTRFDFTSETLEFPSMRTTPSRSSLNRGKNFQASTKSRLATRIPSSSSPSDSAPQNHERPFTSSRNDNGRRKYKASRLVTPSTTRQPLRETRPPPLRLTENYPEGAPHSGGFDDYVPSPRTATHFTAHIPLEVTSPRIEQNYLPNDEERLFNYPVTTEAAAREETVRPIVVTPPNQGIGSYSIADADAFSQYNLGQSSNEFNPRTKETSFVFSKANSKSISEEWVTSTPAFALSTSSGTAEESLPFVTRNPQLYSGTPNTKNGLGSGLTFSPTQSTLGTPQHKSGEQSYFTTLDDSKSMTPQPFTYPESSQKTVSHEGIGITQSLPPTTGALNIPHSVERGAAERTPPKNNSHTLSRLNDHYNPTTTGSTESLFPSQETAKSRTQYNPTTITGTHSLSPTQPATILLSQQNNGSHFTATTQSLSPSEADSNELVEQKEESSPPPSGHSFSSGQAISGSSDFNNNFGFYPFAFANSLANAFLSDQQTTASPIASPSLSPTPSSLNPAPQSTQETFPGPTDYQRRSRPSLSNFVNSFASANAFVSDEGYSQPTTPSSASTPTLSTSKSLNTTQAFPSSTLKTTSTTPKLLYTPTVPQTTARPLTTETPSKKSFSASTSVTTFPKTTAFVPRTSPNIPKITSFHSQNPTSTTAQPIDFSPTTSATPSTTKTLKGFFITHPPPTRSTSAKTPNKEPKSTYLPQLPVTISAPTLPSTYSYQPPSSKTPDFYYRPSPTAPTRSTSPKTPNKEPKSTYFPQLPVTISAPTLSSTYSYQPPSSKTLDFYYRPSPIATKSTYSTSSVDSVKSVSHTLNPSSFNPQEQTAFRQPQSSYGPPIAAPPYEPPTKRVSTTTEPSFVIQKSVELFAAHEVAFHPSVFSQSSYSLSSLQDDYKTGGDDRPALVPPAFLVPSPKARGFEKWNTEDHTDKLTHPKASKVNS